MFITEIFKSIQGESTFAGLPCVFVRLTGCNLRCRWCDTEYAFHGGDQTTIDQVLERVDELGGELVEITGGEPLLQEEVYPLMERLLERGKRVMLETSGERPLDRVPREVVKIVDVKCPDSGEPDTFRLENFDCMAPHDEVKFVVSSRKDYEFARDLSRDRRLGERFNAVIFSPVHEETDLQAMASWMIEDQIVGARFGHQLHKTIWGAETQGV